MASTSRPWPILGATLGVTAASAPASALATVTYPSASVTWTAPPECPSEAAATALIEGFLGQSLGASRVQRIAVAATVTGAGTGFAAELLVTTERGRFDRHLDHSDCAKLTEAAAFVVALAIDPERVQGKDPPSGAAVADPSSPPTPGPSATFAPLAAPTAPPCPDFPGSPEPCHCPPPPPPPPPPPAPVAAPRLSRGSAIVTGLAGTGALPAVGPGVGIEGAWAPAPWVRVAGQARWWAPREAAIRGYEAAGVRLELAQFGVVGCVLPVTGRLEARTCAGLFAGVMSGVGVAVTDGEPKRDRWSAVLGQASLGLWAGPHWGPVLGLEGGPALERPRFGVTAADGTPIPAHRAGPWVASAWVGLQFGSRADLLK